MNFRKSNKTAVSKRGTAKLCSKSGASLTVALLFFLVCAVIGAIVLTAATAAAGRINRLAEADQRYSSVTSAALLLRDGLDGKKTVVTLSRTTKRSVVTHYTVETDGTVTPDGIVTGEPFEISYASAIDGNGTIHRTDDLLSDVAINIVFGPVPNETAGEAAWNYTASSPTFSDLAFTVVPNFSGVDNTALEVNVTASLASDYTLTLVFENKNGEEKYRMRLVCTPQITTDLSQHENAEGHTVVEGADGMSYTETETVATVEEKTVTIRWTVSDVTTYY